MAEPKEPRDFADRISLLAVVLIAIVGIVLGIMFLFRN